MLEDVLKKQLHTQKAYAELSAGYIKQREYRANEVKHLLTVSAGYTVGELPEHEEENQDGAWAWDGADDKALDPARVKQARKEELDYVVSKRVWENGKCEV